MNRAITIFLPLKSLLKSLPRKDEWLIQVILNEPAHFESLAVNFNSCRHISNQNNRLDGAKYLRCLLIQERLYYSI